MAQIIPGTSIHAAVRIVPKATTSSSVTKPPLFYISRSLFENKRLKRRQRIRLKKRLNPKIKTTKNTKTDKKKKKLSTLVANITINLLSDDDDDDEPTPPPSAPTKETARMIEPTMTNDESIVITSDSEEDEKSVPPPLSLSATTSQNDTTNIFPMQPDETIVQTEIGNRVYHMPLNKLREGLDLNNANNEKNDGKRKKSQRPPYTEPPPTPISLHLSKNLSISLVSEDEEDQEEFIDLKNDTVMPQIIQNNSKTAVVGYLPKRCKLV